MIKEMETGVREKVDVIRQMKMMAIAKFIIPFCLAGVAVLFLWFAGSEVYTKYATVFGIYSFMPILGLETAIPTGLSLGIHPAALISFLLYTDAVISMFLVWNLDYAKKIPYIGKLVERTEEEGEKAIKKYKWAKRFGFVGLTIFVVIPFQYTGSVAGSIVGRVIGMTPLMTWLAVVIGCSTRSTIWTLISIGVLSFF